MEVCKVAADIYSEFMEVAINIILYWRNVYPAGAFEKGKIYNIPVHIAVHPEVQSYIENCIKIIHKLIENNEVEQVVICIFDRTLKPIEQFIFDIKIPTIHTLDENNCFLDVELALRSFCLKIATFSGIIEPDPLAFCFAVQLHTKESTGAALAFNEDVADEKSPWIEADSEHVTVKGGVIVPLRAATTCLGKTG
ncbi:mitotic spindle assembly checkpoint protein MAD2B-like isoform X3 [Limulus polyphemus]|uniref:Mitotic spindle assembly checkpoint protein MAD2B-like isoform X3 n=1 Tax=Limulus polyphemus TaxID=6850 RepID=A0ABM1T814_LIMPO|nr:mitotic spindle assembly checkpoint protein MAD2B-like isoform X3 [Limulus polyphemus]